VGKYGEWYSERCRERKEPEDVPQAQCPKCKQWQDDFDGFGVLHCEACGYCTHPSITNAGVCELCGKAQ
jgi:hypothetical protein